MSPVHKRGDPVRLLGRRLLLAGLLALAVGAGFAVWGTYQKERESAALMKEAQAQAHSLTQRETALKTDIANMDSTRGKEAALREQYNMAKQGEGLIVIVNQQAPAAPTASSTSFVDWLRKAVPWW